MVVVTHYPVLHLIPNLCLVIGKQIRSRSHVNSVKSHIDQIPERYFERLRNLVKKKYGWVYIALFKSVYALPILVKFICEVSLTHPILLSYQHNPGTRQMESEFVLTHRR